MTGAPTWEWLRPKIEARDVDGLQAAVIGADEAQRRALAKPFETYVRRELPELGWAFQTSEAESYLPSLAVVAVGCLPSAAAAATLLSRSALRDHWRYLPSARMVEIYRHRDVPWLGDLAVRLAAKLSRDPWAPDWQRVAELVVAAGISPPSEDLFIRGWVSWLGILDWERRGLPDIEGAGRGIPERIQWGPFLDVFTPRLFEIDGLGSQLRTGIPEALVELTRTGRLGRKVMLDGCIVRLHHPDRPGSLRVFTDLHDELKPSLDELAERAADYADLAADASSPVAGFAQRQLQTLQKAGRLDLDLLLQGSPPVLARAEKVLVKGQLALLDQAARSDPDRSGDVALAAATAFGHPAFDLQQRALTLVSRYAPAGTEAQRDELAAAAGALSPDLHTPAQQALGHPVGSSPEPTPELPSAPDNPPVPYPALPPAIADQAELRATLQSATWRLLEGHQLDRERLMAGLVAMADDDGAEVAALLAQECEQVLATIWSREQYLARNLVTGQEDWPKMLFLHGNPDYPAQTDSYREAHTDVLAGNPPRALTNSADLLRIIGTLRMAELRAGLELDARPPVLLATPTDTSGRIDPEALLHRIEAIEAVNQEPWPLDLEQALLRLPLDVDPEVVSRAGRLRSPAGVRVARWLAAGPPADPIATVVGAGYPAKILPGPPGDRRPTGWRRVNLSMAEEPRSGLHSLLFSVGPSVQFGWLHLDPLEARVLPSHREVTAAWILMGTDSVGKGDRIGLLPSGTDSGGPAGPALTLLLAYALGAERAPSRVAGTDAILSLAAAGNLDAPALGEHLGALIADGVIVLARVVPPLAEAARAGAMTATWDIIVAMLPYVPAVKGTGLPDLLALGVETATATGRRDVIPELAEIAARTGSSRTVIEARRLQRALQP